MAVILKLIHQAKNKNEKAITFVFVFLWCLLLLHQTAQCIHAAIPIMQPVRTAVNKKGQVRITTAIYITAEVGRATSTATVHLRRDLFARNGRCFYFLIFYY